MNYFESVSRTAFVRSFGPLAMASLLAVASAGCDDDATDSEDVGNQDTAMAQDAGDTKNNDASTAQDAGDASDSDASTTPDAGDGEDNDASTTTVAFETAPDASLVTTGTVEVITEDTVRYHVLVIGSLVTVTLVETATGVVIVDVGFHQFDHIATAGTELRAYADALDKPISVIVTHAHQDHYGNLDSFADVDVYAETRTAEALMADSMFTDLYAGKVIAVSDTKELAGLEFGFANVPNAEAPDNGYVYIDSVGALFPGDLVFNSAHGFIREYTPLDDLDELDSWKAGLDSMKAAHGDYGFMFLGHNSYRTDTAEAIEENIDYLSTAQGLIAGTIELTGGGFASSVQEVVDDLALRYPTYSDGGLLLALPDGFFPGDPGATWF